MLWLSLSLPDFLKILTCFFLSWFPFSVLSCPILSYPAAVRRLVLHAYQNTCAAPSHDPSSFSQSNHQDHVVNTLPYASTGDACVHILAPCLTCWRIRFDCICLEAYCPLIIHFVHSISPSFFLLRQQSINTGSLCFIRAAP
ncbi:hypothetical protein F5B21DRAFT_23265 [Xylaria acuta]|nr:hypothetical protein F5B21DRAFT_23265 [Xylaria acuta]